MFKLVELFEKLKTSMDNRGRVAKMFNIFTYLGLFTSSGLLFLVMVKTWYKLSTGVCRSQKLLEGKTVLITGANRGIGKATAIELARRKAKVILACRDTDKATSAAEDIIKLTGNPNVTVTRLDLSSFESVRQCARSILDNEERLDVLINNAGIVSDHTGRLTVDGVEEHYATNYFGPFLLTTLLLPLIKRSAPSRIVNLSSIMHFWGSIDFNDVFGKNVTRGPIGMYSNTKLGNILFTRYLSEKLEGSGVTVNAVHPGNVETDIANQLPKWMLRFAPLVKYTVVKSLEDGAQTSIYAAVSEDVEGVSGQYFADCGVAYSSPASKDVKQMELLWKLSEKVTGLSQSAINNEKL